MSFFSIFSSREPAPAVARVVLRMGKRGRWRWSAYDADDDLRALAPVRGWASAHDARADASVMFPCARISHGSGDMEDGE